MVLTFGYGPVRVTGVAIAWKDKRRVLTFWGIKHPRKPPKPPRGNRFADTKERTESTGKKELSQSSRHHCPRTTKILGVGRYMLNAENYCPDWLATGSLFSFDPIWGFENLGSEARSGYTR